MTYSVSSAKVYILVVRHHSSNRECLSSALVKKLSARRSHRATRSIHIRRSGKAAAAVARLIEFAEKDIGPSRRVVDFLLAWHNANENGGWDITDLWNVDQNIADDMFTVLHLIRSKRQYPDDLGFKDELQRVWQQWRSCNNG